MGITRTEALEALRSDDLIGIGMEADAVRRRLHPEGVVTYAVASELALDPALEAVPARAAHLLSLGGSGLRLTGAASLELPQLLAVISAIRAQLPETWIEALTVPELLTFAAATPAPQLLAQLHDAGLDSLIPDGADLTASPESWLDIHRAAHHAGLHTQAVLRFGAGETPESRVDLLDAIRTLQAETGGFHAFTLEPAGSGLHGPTAVETLKLLAVSRLVLDEIPNLQAGMSQGLKVLEVALRFGANDAGLVSISAASKPDLREEDLRRIIRDAGFLPAERDLGYRMMFVG